MCKLVRLPANRLAVYTAFELGPDGAGVAYYGKGGLLVIERDITLDRAQALAATVHGALFCRSDAGEVRRDGWCQPFLTADGRALFARGSRSEMRQAVCASLDPDELHKTASVCASPVAVAASMGHLGIERLKSVAWEVLVLPPRKGDWEAHWTRLRGEP